MWWRPWPETQPVGQAWRHLLYSTPIPLAECVASHAGGAAWWSQGHLGKLSPLLLLHKGFFWVVSAVDKHHCRLPSFLCKVSPDQCDPWQKPPPPDPIQGRAATILSRWFSHIPFCHGLPHGRKSYGGWRDGVSWEAPIWWAPLERHWCLTAILPLVWTHPSPLLIFLLQQSLPS